MAVPHGSKKKNCSQKKISKAESITVSCKRGLWCTWWLLWASNHPNNNTRASGVKFGTAHPSLSFLSKNKWYIVLGKTKLGIHQKKKKNHSKQKQLNFDEHWVDSVFPYIKFSVWTKLSLTNRQILSSLITAIKAHKQ